MSASTSEVAQIKEEEEPTIEEEYESSIILPLKQHIYNNIKNNFKKIDTEIIFYFDNGVRKSKNYVQYKVINECKNVLKFIYLSNTILFLPLTRKYALEYPAAIPEDISTIETIIYRTIIHQEANDQFNMRIAIECVQNTIGKKYQLTADIEYDKIVYNRPILVIDIEELLLTWINSCISKYIENISSDDIFSFGRIDTIFNVPSRVFSSLSERYYNQGTEYKLFKWDGYKGRFYSNGRKIYIYDDLNNLDETDTDLFSFAPNIFWQVEIMHAALNEKTRDFIITDIIGGYINHTLFTPEPLDVIKCFQFLNTHAYITEESCLIFKHIGSFKVFTQYPVYADTPIPNKPIDGYILYCINGIFKFKVPSIDVKAVNNFLQLDEECHAISAQSFPNLENGAIYEVTPVSTNNKKTDSSIEYKILRLRIQKNWSSTKEEYQKFLNEIAHLRKYML